MDDTTADAGFHYSRGRRFNDAHPENKSAPDFDAFADAVLSDRSAAKGHQYIAAAFKPNGDGRPHRCKDGALPSAFIAFDLDGFSDPEDWHATLGALQPFQGFAYTTASHTPTAPRARAVLAATRAMERTERQRVSIAVQDRLNREVGDGCIKFDESVYRAEQPIFCPPVNADTYRFTGQPVDVDNVLKDAPTIKEGGSAKQRAEAIATDDPVLAELHKRGMVRQQMDGGRFAIVCPFEHEHTEHTSDTATVYMLPNFDGVKYGKFHCLHAHCKDREQSDYLKALDLEPSSVWKAQRGENPETALWPEPVDVFAEQPVPPFPLDCLPPAYATFAESYAAQSGFDPGAYGFCLLVNAANAIDHRSRLAVAHSFKVPPVLWGGLVDNSGGGKSPIINAASKFAREIDDIDTAQSADDLSAWEALPKKGRGDAETPRWVQRLALDTTVEKLGDLLTDNPEGVFLIADELTELIGRLDAYSNGGGKDRATYLRAFDGGATTINRVGRGNRRIENFSLGILAGIQPDKLAELYRRNGGGGDGLYQRFLFYVIAPPKPADYAARIAPHIDIDMRVQIEGLWRRRFTADLSPAAARLANDYHNNMRTLAQRTPGPRLAEHLSKYPGFINRVALALHAMEGVSGRHGFTGTVAPETWRRAHAVMACLYRHAEAAYSLLDETAGETMRLVRSAAEAILSQGWEELTRANLTTRATGWRSADHRTAEGAIDLLIELGWLHDVTAVQPHRRGRRSDGRWTINPGVHSRFMQHAERIKAARAERFAAIKHAAEVRTDAPIC